MGASATNSGLQRLRTRDGWSIDAIDDQTGGIDKIQRGIDRQIFGSTISPTILVETVPARCSRPIHE